MLNGGTNMVVGAYFSIEYFVYPPPPVKNLRCNCNVVSQFKSVCSSYITCLLEKQRRYRIILLQNTQPAMNSEDSFYFCTLQHQHYQTYTYVNFFGMNNSQGMHCMLSFHSLHALHLALTGPTGQSSDRLKPLSFLLSFSQLKS